MTVKPPPATSASLLLPTVERQTGESPKCAIIWLHGLGADGHDFEPIVDEFDFDQLPALRFVFPHAPMRAVTINGAT
jgi:phospholipase/carboxylesterase